MDGVAANSRDSADGIEGTAPQSDDQTSQDIPAFQPDDEGVSQHGSELAGSMRSTTSTPPPERAQLSGSGIERARSERRGLQKLPFVRQGLSKPPAL